MLGKTPQIITAILALKKYCQNEVNVPAESPSTTAQQKSLVQSFVLSEIEMVNEHKLSLGADEDLEGLEILSEVEKQLLKYQKMSIKVKRSFDHICNFLENFQLLGEQMDKPSILLTQCYKYCNEHITNTIKCLRQVFYFTGADCYQPQKSEGGNKSRLRKQFFQETDGKISSILENVNKIIDELEDKKDENFYPSTMAKNIGKNNKKKDQIAEEVEFLRKKIQDYEKQRQTFIKIHEYYEQQLSIKDKKQTITIQREQNNEPEILPTFNFDFVRKPSRSYYYLQPSYPKHYEQYQTYENHQRNNIYKNRNRY